MPNSTERRVNATSFVNVEAIHEVVRYLASRCDGANELDGQGFNKDDYRMGHLLARAPKLSEQAAEETRDMVRKYRRQIPVEMWRAMWR